MAYFCNLVQHFSSTSTLMLIGLPPWRTGNPPELAVFFFLGNSLISWSSKKQQTISRSSTESEYRALADLAAELLWIRCLWKEISFPVHNPFVLWCDSISSQALATNPVLHAQSKHIELDIHFIRDKVLSKELEVRYVPSTNQLAYCLTKPLSHSLFTYLRDKLGLHHHYHPSLNGDVTNKAAQTSSVKSNSSQSGLQHAEASPTD